MIAYQIAAWRGFRVYFESGVKSLNARYREPPARPRRMALPGDPHTAGNNARDDAISAIGSIDSAYGWSAISNAPWLDVQGMGSWAIRTVGDLARVTLAGLEACAQAPA